MSAIRKIQHESGSGKLYLLLEMNLLLGGCENSSVQPLENCNGHLSVRVQFLS